ncbi:MAG: TetR/AcrR family transcriptional regulator [Myxococcota bacterium]
MARPRTFNEEDVLQRAMELFWRQGYRATTMQDLVRVTGVQRNSLYRIFGNKAAIFQQILDRYGAWRIGKLDMSQPPRDLIRQWLMACADEARAGTTPRGCLLVLSSTEMHALEPAVRAVVQTHLDQLEQFFTTCVRSAAPDADAEAIGAALLAADIGLFLMSHAGASPERLTSIVERTLYLIPNA